MEAHCTHRRKKLEILSSNYDFHYLINMTYYLIITRSGVTPCSVTHQISVTGLGAVADYYIGTVNIFKSQYIACFIITKPAWMHF